MSDKCMHETIFWIDGKRVPMCHVVPCGNPDDIDCAYCEYRQPGEPVDRELL